MANKRSCKHDETGNSTSDVSSCLSGNCSSSSSTSSSQININVPSGRRSNITILTDSSSDNWTFRNINHDVVADSKNINSNSNTIQTVQQQPVVCENNATHTSCTNINNGEISGRDFVKSSTCNKEVVRIRKGFKFYGSRSNQKPVLNGLDLCLREGDM